MTDAANTASNNAQPESKPAKPVKPQSDSGGLWFLAILTFIIAIGGLAAGYYAWTLLQQQLTTQTATSENLQREIKKLPDHNAIQSVQNDVNQKFSRFSKGLNETETSLKEMATDQEAMWESVKKVAQYTTDNRLSWMLKEVEYVLRIAQHSLSLNHDLFTSRKALQAADVRLAELADPRILPIRKSIAAQLQKLDRIDQVDYAGLELKIDNTISGLHKNVLKEQQLFSDKRQQQADSKSSDTTATNETDSPDMIEKALQATKNALSKKVVVTRGEQEVALFIEQQEKKRAYEFLHAKLLGAKYAVATRDDENYHQQLKAALAWIKEYQTLYNHDQLESTLQSLNATDLQPEYPDISEPYVKLQGLMHTLKVDNE